MGRCEACASRSGPVKSALDGLGAGLGYSLVLCAIALLREPVGSGTLMGYPIFGEGFEPARIVALAPGAFIGMGIIVWLVRGIWPELTDQASPVQSGR
jgi:Na+-transporting NADH:ubiquinone oxidoreductase subunit NqrD